MCVCLFFGFVLFFCFCTLRKVLGKTAAQDTRGDDAESPFSGGPCVGKWHDRQMVSENVFSPFHMTSLPKVHIILWKDAGFPKE